MARVALTDDNGALYGAPAEWANNRFAQISSIIKGSRTAIIGDSIDAAGKGWFVYYALQSGRIPIVRNAGVGGDTTAMMLARLQADVLDHNPDIVITGGSTNDQQQGVPEATTRANIAELVDRIIAAGATPVLRTTPPSDNAGTAPWDTVDLRRQAILRHNAWLRGYAASRGIDVLDIYQAVADPATGGFQAGISDDGLHPNEAGYKAIADYLLSLGVPPAFRGGFSFARAVTDEGNMLKNGVFIGDTDGNGLANGWTNALGSPIYSLTPAAEGITGNWQRITAPDSSSVAMIQDIFATDGARVVYDIGDTIEWAGRISTSGGPQALVRVAMWGGPQSSDPDTVAQLTMPVTNGVFSGRKVIPEGTTKVRLQIQLSKAAGWMEVAEISVRNLTKLGLA